MRTLKKTLSLLLTLIMVSAFVQIPGQAAMANNAPKAQFKLVALSPDDETVGLIGSYGFGAVNPESLGLPNKKVGDMFYVGIQVTGIDDIEEYATHGLGVTGLSAAFTYDKDYIQLVEDFTSDPTIGTNSWYLYMDLMMGQEYKMGSRTYYYTYYKDASNYTYDLSACESRADESGGDPTVYYMASWGGTEFSTTSSYVFGDGDIIAILPFKIVSMPGPGTELFSFSTKNTAYSLDFGIGTDAKAKSYQLANGDTVESEADPKDSTDILHVMEFSADGVNFFPESETADAIIAKGAVTNTIQYADTAIDLTGNLSADFTIGSMVSAADPSDYDWYFGEGGKTSTDGLTKIVAGTTKWPAHDVATTTSTYSLYAVGKGCIDELDGVTITVNTDTVQSITGVRDSYPTQGYADSTISFSNLKANVTMTSGASYTDVGITDFAKRGIALYKVSEVSGSTIYEEWTSDQVHRYPEVGAAAVTYIIGTDNAAGVTTKPTVVAKYTPDGGSEIEDVFSVTGTTDKLNISTNSSNAIKTAYAVGAVIDPSGLKFYGKLDSAGSSASPTEMGWSDIQSKGNLELVIAGSGWDGSTGIFEVVNEGTPSTTTLEATDLDGSKRLYVRVNNGTADAPVYKVIEVGTLALRTPTAITVPTIADKTYGDKLGTIKIGVKWNNGDADSILTETVGTAGDTSVKKEISDAGIVMGIGTDKTVAPETIMVPSAHNDMMLDFYATQAAANAGTILASTAKLVVNKVKIPVSVVANADVNKPYDGTTTLPDNAVALAPVLSPSPWVLSDADDYASDESTIVPAVGEGLTFEYDTRHASATNGDKKVKYTVDATKAAFKAAKGTGATDTTVSTFNEKYEYVLDSTISSPTFKADGTVDGLTGTISPHELDVTKFTFTSIDNVIQDDEANKAKTDRTQNLVYATDGDGNIAGDGLLHEDDVVQIKYDYTYGDIDTPTVGDATATVTVTNIALVIGTGNQSGNYTLSDTTATASGKILPKEVTGVAVGENPPTFDYQYPNKTLNLSSLKVDVTYAGGGSATSYTAEEFLKNVDGATIQLVDKDGKPVVDGDNNTITITSTNFASVCDLPYGEYKLIIGVGSGPDAKTATLDGVTAVKKPISLADLTLSYTATYGKLDEATKTATIADSALESGDKVTLDATFTPANTNAGTTDVTVELTLADEDKDNYVLVDAEGNPITETTITGTIGQATYDAPAAPVTQVDLYNNTVLVDLKDVVTAGLEYVVVSSSATPSDAELDALDWFTADEMTAPTSAYFSEYADTLKTVPYVYNAAGEKEEGTLGETYTVYVRRAADANHIASAPATAPATLYPYAVTVSLAGSEDTVFAIYTDDATLDKATDDNSFNENVLNGWMPSRFKAYFTDLEATTLVNYTELAADAEGKIKVYYTRKRTSSSSTGSTSLANTVTVTYDVKGSGIIVENDKNEKVPVGQSVAAVPTVTAKDGYIFRGWTLDGETVIDPATVKITEDTVFIALFEEVEETDPVIDPNYIDPYANGYPDGSFQADRVLTRGELAAMIARIHYEDELPDNTYYASFEDVKEGDWYNKYIGYVEGLGVMNGYPDGTFRPTNPITRAEFASVLVRAQKYDIIASDELFNDIAGHWAKDNITTLGSLKVVNGYEDGTFLPENPLTRGEAVTMINRILKPSKIVSNNRPNDIDGHWAEDAIYLAVNERMLIEEGAEEAAE